VRHQSAGMLALTLLSGGLVAGPPGVPRVLPAARAPRAPPAMRLADDGILGVGVIGAGRIGLVHLEALAQCENVRAVIISNPTESKARAAADKFKLPEATSDAMAVINHPEVEAVWICSPSQYHAEQIKACAAAGKVRRSADPARPSTLDPRPSTLDPRPATLDPRPSTRDPRPSPAPRARSTCFARSRSPRTLPRRSRRSTRARPPASSS
jgi:hypothetical protein